MSSPTTRSKAKRELDALGWRLQRPVPGEGRPATGGPRLVLRRAEHPAVRPDRAAQPRPDRREARTDAKAGSGFFTNYINVGDFRHRPIRLGRATRSRCRRSPRSMPPTARATSARSAVPEIDAKIEQTLQELDPAKARALANEVDKADLGRGVQPAAGPVARQRRGPQLAGQLRCGRVGRPGLHRDRVHALTPACRLGR